MFPVHRTQYIYLDSKFLVPFACFAQLVLTDLCACGVPVAFVVGGCRIKNIQNSSAPKVSYKYAGCHDDALSL